MITATLKKIDKENELISTFWFEPEKPVKYIAGQFIEMLIEHESPDDRGKKRWFTLSSSPTDPMISITTKIIEKCSTFKAKLNSLKAGDRVQISEPMGDFVLPKDSKIPLLFIAGGIGITPFHSIISFLVATEEKREIELIYALNDDHEIAFRRLWPRFEFKKFTELVKDPNPGWQGQTGVLTSGKIMGYVGDSKDKLIYMSGPEAMVETFNEDLLKAGIPKHRIVGDYFPGYTKI
jgi:ferredoxin-NADP reductase